jgi:hypothetical protein
MATKPKTTEGASAFSNVVRLPTAAPRKVDNGRWAEQRRAVIAARKGNPWNAETEFDVIRTAETKRRSEAMGTLQRDPALLLVMALIQAADAKTRDRVYSIAFQAAFRDPSCDASHQAYQIAARLSGHALRGE